MTRRRSRTVVGLPTRGERRHTGGRRVRRPGAFHHRSQLGQELHQGGRVDVPRRHPHLPRPDEAGRQRALEVGEMGGGLRHGLLVGVGHVHRSEPAQELGVEAAAGLGHGVAIGVGLADEALGRGVVGDAHVAEAVLGAIRDRPRRSEAGDPHRRMGLLQRAGPGVHVGQLVEAAVEGEGARPRPRLEHEVHRLAKAGAGPRWG